MAVDETLVKFKRKNYFCQFIPIKPGCFGIKCFTLAESSSGYVLVSKIYLGKEQGVQQNDLGSKEVLVLMEKFLDKGYVLFMVTTIHRCLCSKSLVHAAHLLVGQSSQTGKGFQKI